MKDIKGENRNEENQESLKQYIDIFDSSADNGYSDNADNAAYGNQAVYRNVRVYGAGDTYRQHLFCRY